MKEARTFNLGPSEMMYVNTINSVMILPQVHLRKPCYDFYFL